MSTIQSTICPLHMRIARGAACAGLSLALVLAACPVSAHAESLEKLQEAAIAANDSYEKAEQESQDLQKQIEDNEAKIHELEAKLPGLRNKAAAAMRASYKLQQAQGDLVMLLLSAEDFNQFVTQAAYLDIITESNANAIKELNDSVWELNTTKDELTKQKEDADVKLAEAQRAKEEADAARNAAVAAATADTAQNEAAYASGQITDTTSQQISAATGNAPANNDAPANGGSNSGNVGTSYTYVGASTYGEGDGFMYGKTASGALVTPTSMGVAMRSMPLGTVIEITYNGHTVQAVVNDRGPFTGNRQIDLQPAVAHALGFSGVGTLGYRVVG